MISVIKVKLNITFICFIGFEFYITFLNHVMIWYFIFHRFVVGHGIRDICTSTEFHTIFNPSGFETEIFGDNHFNTVVVAALALCVVTTSATMLLTKDKRVLAVDEEGFKLPVPSQC